MSDSFATRLRNGETVVGTMLRLLAHPCTAELAADAGMDVLFVDMEHGAFSMESLAALAPACRANDVALAVRVPELARAWVSRALDCGADAVMVPMLETADQARQLVAWAKYPPLGGRGLSSIGPHSGTRRIGGASNFMAAQNERVLTIAQIETAAGVANVDAIAAIDGIDALLVGPNDLAVSLGCPDDPMCDTERQAIAKVADAAAAHGKTFGMHANAAMIGAWVSRGLRLVVHGLDYAMLADGFRAVTNTVRELDPSS